MKLFKSIFLSFFSCFKSLLCFLNISKRRKLSGEMLLPLHNNFHIDKKQLNEDVEEWSSWDNNGLVENNKISNQHNHSNNSRRHSKSDDRVEDDDLFKELEPNIQITKKYFVGEKMYTNKINKNPKSFSYSTEAIGQLGTLDDEYGWDIGDIKLNDDNRNSAWAH